MDKYYVTYGSNLNKEQMGYRCPNAEAIGTAVIENYELLFHILPLKNLRAALFPWEFGELMSRTKNILTATSRTLGNTTRANTCNT